MLFSISAKTMFGLQSENGECHVCLILEYRRLHDKIARLVSGGAEEAGMKGWRGHAARMSVSPLESFFLDLPTICKLWATFYETCGLIRLWLV